MTHPRHDTHAIPAGDEPKPAYEETALPITDAAAVLARLDDAYVEGIGHGNVIMDREGDEWTAVKAEGSQSARFFWNYKPGDEVHYAPGSTLEEVLSTYGPVTKAPAKTHDLTVHREHGNVVVTAEAESGNCKVYLQDGIALDLGRVLAVLTPTQRQLLVDDLTGGEK